MPNSLIHEANLADYDLAYQLIIDMHKELSDEESQLANAKLILTLANHIGDINVLREATRITRQNTIEWRSE